MNLINQPNDERLRLHEAIGVTALIVFVAANLTFWIGVLVMRCYVVDAFDHFKKQLNRHVPR